MAKKWIQRIAAAALALCLMVPGVNGVLAYQTDAGEVLENKTTIALDCSSVLVEYYPSVQPKLTSATNTIDYTKLIQVANTGYVDEYVRVKLEFSDSDVEKKTYFSSNGTNYYKVSDYQKHLPSGWVYNTNDGFYYYTKTVESGDWAAYKNRLTFDAGSGQYYYKDTNYFTAALITVPLVRYMRTTFSSPTDMRSYYLNVYQESCPFYFGSDYSSAWSNYINQ